jgi:integrase
MKYVMPIEDKRIIADISDYLKESNERDYVLFMTGIYLGRRIGDMLQYRVRDLRDKDRIAIEEQKTGKVILLSINPHLQKIYKEYFRGKKDYEYVFRNEKRRGNHPITRQRAAQILQEAGEAVGYRESLSCHVMRKTFGYWLYQDSGGDIVMVQELLGHDDPSITRRYIGVDQVRKEKAINSLNFG